MTPSSGLHFKTVVLILIMISVAPLGDTFLGKGMKKVGTFPGWAPGDLFHFFFRAFTSGTIWIAIGLLLSYFVAYLLVLSWADYSYVMPAGAFGYALQTLLAVMILHEAVNAQRWIGVVLIVTGVLLVGQTHPSTTQPKAVAP